MRDDPSSLGELLLDWYDANARTMPWRTPPAARAAGVMPDPYHVWLSEVMLQQTTVAAVTGYFRRFLARWPTVGDLAAAADADVMAEWAGLGYYARARNLLKGARAVVADHGGRFPQTLQGLQSLPGVGPYTAAAVAAIAFDLPATVVDGNVERVMARLFAVQEPLPSAKKALTALAAGLTLPLRPGDHAQAVMDLGATICTPRNPVCGLCPWRPACAAHQTGEPAQLPRRLAKPPKPVRHGLIWLARRADGAWLLEQRPPRGLLGGMLGWPGTDWVDVAQPLPATPAPVAAAWRDAGATVRHTFTHFHLMLAVQVAEVPLSTTPHVGKFVPLPNFRPADLPTLMRKAHAVAASALAPH